MAADHDDHHGLDERIADAIRDLAAGDGQVTSPPPALWGRIERAIDDEDGGTGGETADAAGGVALAPPPPDLWDRIATEVRREAHREGDPPARAGAGGHERRSPGWGRRIGLVAAAVLLIGALAVGALVVSRDDGPSSELVARAALSGAGLDPGGDGTGSAELRQDGSDWKVAIDVDRLPALPAGSYYEAWLLGTGPGQVQSLGTLPGSGGFAVPEGLAIEDYPLVDVSIEPIDGDPGHSSKSVLRGRLEST